MDSHQICNYILIILINKNKNIENSLIYILFIFKDL